MSKSNNQALASSIEAAIRSVPGISTVFRSGSSVSNALDTGARLLGIKDESAPLVRVTRAGDELTVELSIGVTDKAPAIARSAYDVVLAELAAQGIEDAKVQVRLTVVHVDEPSD